MSKNINNEIPNSIKSYKIEKEAFKFSNMVLYSATNTDINEKVLIHVFPKEQIKSNANEVTFMNNHVYLMKLLNHKNILKLYEIIETKKFAFLVYEYFEGVKLSDFISKKKKLTEDESIEILKELLSALTYLHDMYVFNLNINSNNIIIDTKKNIKLCDFKYGHFYSNKEKSRSTLIGEHFSACPELHSKKPYSPELADMWSTGILLFEMVTGQLPFKSQKDLDLIRLIIKGNYTIPNGVSNNMKTVIKGLLEVKEDKRFKINDLLNQQLLKDKKITKASLTQGLNVLITKYPVDGNVLNICKNSFGLDVAKLIKSLENNCFNPYTSLFKQIVTKLISKGIQTINDLCSDKFVAYLNDTKNFLKEEEQINNIHNYLIKEDEIKKNSQDVAAILLNNQNEISKGLEDLKHQYEQVKKGIKPIKRNRSFGNAKNKRRRTFQLDNNKDIMRTIKKLNNMANNVNGNNNTSFNKKKNNLNLKPVKRNTICVPEMNNFGLEQKLNKKNKNNKKNGPLPNKPGGRFDNVNRNENKNDKKTIEEIKEENEKEKEDSKSKKSLSNSNSEKSVSSKSSSNSEKSEEKSEEKKEEKKESEPKKVESKPEEKKANNAPVKTVKPENKQPINPINAVKITKVPPTTKPVEQKPKKILMNNIQQNELKPIMKRSENNDKKVKIFVKKEEIDKEQNILKIKSELKKGVLAKSTADMGKSVNTKKEEPKVSGFKSIKEMIENNIKKQRVMSSGFIKGDKKKNPPKK